MKIACTYKNYEDDSKRWIDEMIQIGFSYMEIATGLLPENEDEQEEVIAYALSRGLTLNLHAPYGINNISAADKARRESSIANAKRAIDLAAKYSLGTVTFHPGRLSEGDTEKENRQRMMEIVADLARYAKERKVFLGIENMELRPYELVYTVDDLNLFAKIGEDNEYFGVTIDYAHYSSHGIGMPNVSDLKLPIYDVHLSQNVNAKMHCSLASDNGIVDVEAVCRQLSDYGYDGLVVLEVALNTQAESKAFLENVLASLDARNS